MLYGMPLHAVHTYMKISIYNVNCTYFTYLGTLNVRTNLLIHTHI